VSAFDSKREFDAAYARARRDLVERADHFGDPREHLSGSRLEPGDRARARAGRLVRRSLEHGVDPWALIPEQALPRDESRYTSDAPHPRLTDSLRRLRRWFRRQLRHG